MARTANKAFLCALHEYLNERKENEACSTLLAVGFLGLAQTGVCDSLRKEVLVVFSEPLDNLCVHSLFRELEQGKLADIGKIHKKSQYYEVAPNFSPIYGAQDGEQEIAVKMIPVRQFISQDILHGGQADHTNFLYLPSDTMIYEHELWKDLKRLLPPMKDFIALRYLIQSHGYAYGTIQRLKKKKGKSKYRPEEARSALALCLHHVDNVQKLLYHEGEDVKVFRQEDDLVRQQMQNVVDGVLTIKEAIELMPDVQKTFEILKQRKTSEEDNKVVDHEIFEAWFSSFSLCLINPSRKADGLLPSFDECHHIERLLQQYNIPLDPKSVIFMTQSGSFMYGLNTPTSDLDFMIVYALPTKQFQSLRPPDPLIQRHEMPAGGPLKAGLVEFTAKDAEEFVNEILKGFPKNIELLFEERSLYESKLWKILKKQRLKFLSKRVIDQYFRFAEQKLRAVVEGVKEQSKGDAKLFYYIFHKLFELRRILDGENPVVRLSGEERDFVMKIRMSTLLTDDISFRSLEKKAREMLEQLHTKYEQFEIRQFGDFNACLEWVRLVRTVYEVY